MTAGLAGGRSLAYYAEPVVNGASSHDERTIFAGGQQDARGANQSS
jgi:hypothetical protein